MDLNVRKVHQDVLDTIELIAKKKLEFDQKTLKKSMNAIEQAINTYEIADHRANKELYGIQSASKYLLLNQLSIIKPENSLSTIIWQPGSCTWTLAQCNLSKTNQESNVHSRQYVRARDMWRNAIVKMDELSARMEEIYDDFDDGIQAVDESMEDNKDFILNLANNVREWRSKGV